MTVSLHIIPMQTRQLFTYLLICQIQSNNLECYLGLPWRSCSTSFYKDIKIIGKEVLCYLCDLIEHTMLHFYYIFYPSTVVANWFLNDSWPRRVHKSVAWSIDFCDQSHQSLADSRPENSRGDLPRGTETVLIGFDMQCQWITPMANQLQRDANMSGPRQPTNSQAKNSQGKMAWAAGKFGKENRAPNYFQRGEVNRKSNECWGICKQFQECCVYKRPLTVLNCKGFSQFNSFRFAAFCLANFEFFGNFSNLVLFLLFVVQKYLRIRLDTVDRTGIW